MSHNCGCRQSCHPTPSCGCNPSRHPTPSCGCSPSSTIHPVVGVVYHTTLHPVVGVVHIHPAVGVVHHATLHPVVGVGPQPGPDPGDGAPNCVGSRTHMANCSSPLIMANKPTVSTSAQPSWFRPTAVAHSSWLTIRQSARQQSLHGSG